MSNYHLNHSATGAAIGRIFVINKIIVYISWEPASFERRLFRIIADR